MSSHGPIERRSGTELLSLLHQVERAVRRLVFVELRLAQIESDLEAFVPDTPTEESGTSSELIQLAQQILEHQYEMQQAQQESIAHLVQQLEELSHSLSMQSFNPIFNHPMGSDVAACDGQEQTSWELTKQRLLAEANAELTEIGQSNDQETYDKSHASHLELEDLRAQLVAKDQEISKLQGELAEWTEKKKWLEDHELIRQERERLQELQRMWEARLREAEVEISVERAKLARERAELEEKLRTLQSAPQAIPTPESSPTVPRSRWLTRLGLSD